MAKEFNWGFDGEIEEDQSGNKWLDGQVISSDESTTTTEGSVIDDYVKLKETRQSMAANVASNKREEEKINLTCRNGTLDEYDQVVKEHRELFVTEKNYKTKDK